MPDAHNLQMPHSPITDDLLAELRSKIAGQVIVPDDAAYDGLRTIFYGGFDHLPVLIVRVTNAADVAEVIALARETGLTLAVRSGGHSLAGHGVSDGGIVLDMRDMKALQIDVESRTAWAEAGLTTGEYTAAAAEHGLATGFGDTGTVGLGGITLGGGVGFLVRKHGLTIDHLLAAEIVTANGECLYVDADHHPDLFWAIRGGGGNFGVVTRFQFRLHEVDHIYGGMLMLPATSENIVSFVAAAQAAPEALSTIMMAMTAPPMPFIPQEYHGKLIVFAMIVYAGPADEGEQAIAPFRAIAEPMLDTLGAMRYVEMFQEEETEGDDVYHPQVLNTSMFINSVDADAADHILEYLQSSDAPMRVVQFRVLGGAMAHIPVEATAFAHRQSKIMLNLSTAYRGPDKATRERWLADLGSLLHQGDTGAYVNFMDGHDPERIRDAYPGTTWERLSQIKARYDPNNLFSRNHNINPGSDRLSESDF